jgi:hypothetical protein
VLSSNQVFSVVVQSTSRDKSFQRDWFSRLFHTGFHDDSTWDWSPASRRIRVSNTQFLDKVRRKSRSHTPARLLLQRIVGDRDTSTSYSAEILDCSSSSTPLISTVENKFQRRIIRKSFNQCGDAVVSDALMT